MWCCRLRACLQAATEPRDRGVCPATGVTASGLDSAAVQLLGDRSVRGDGATGEVGQDRGDVPGEGERLLTERLHAER